MTETPPGPAPGQIWLTVHSRLGGRDRYVHIDELDGDMALCTSWYDDPKPRRRQVKIRLDRFRIEDNGYGYRYVRDGDIDDMAAPAEPEWMYAADAARYLEISKETLKRWGDRGYISYVALPSGYRKYRRADLDAAQRPVSAKTPDQPTSPPAPRRDAARARTRRGQPGHQE